MATRKYDMTLAFAVDMHHQAHNLREILQQIPETPFQLLYSINKLCNYLSRATALATRKRFDIVNEHYHIDRDIATGEVVRTDPKEQDSEEKFKQQIAELDQQIVQIRLHRISLDGDIPSSLNIAAPQLANLQASLEEVMENEESQS